MSFSISTSMPSAFKAAVLASPKAAHTIETRSLPDLKSDEVGIRIDATAINPVDWKMRDHDLFLPGYPAILGSDAAGTIISLGSSVTSFALNDRVFFQGIIGKPQSSTFQQFATMPSSLLAHTPSNISHEQAAGISLATVAVAVSFYDKIGYGMPAPWTADGSKFGAGKAIVIIGGASSVGQYAIQLARLSGFETIITNASLSNEGMLKELGANLVLDRKVATAADLASAVGSSEVSFVFDAISTSSTQNLGVEILQSVQKRGEDSCLVTLHSVHPDHPDPEAVAAGKKEHARVEIKQVLGMGSSKELRYLSEPLMKALGGEEGWIKRGLFVPNRVRVVDGGLEAVDEALEVNKKGVSGVKVIMKPWDT